MLGEPHEMTEELLVEFFARPWQLVIPPAVSWLRTEEEEERVLLARDLLPLVKPLGLRQRHGGKTVGYRLSRLADGRTTVFALPRNARPDSPIEHVGDSLLEFLHEHHTDHRDALLKQYNAPSNFGTGMVDADEVQEVEALLHHIEYLQRRAADHGMHDRHAAE
ncbi:hypothetical protein ACIBSV_37690 [Embleya sp. NPDC050154]|uniref:hypothetical protein n=1 Tax=Embleya sp. NPDC050154 TaxID=3363988 RepID=UPI0037904BCB